MEDAWDGVVDAEDCRSSEVVSLGGAGLQANLQLSTRRDSRGVEDVGLVGGAAKAGEGRTEGMQSTRKTTAE